MRGVGQEDALPEESACVNVPDLANENKGCSVKLGFQINHK